MSDFAITDAPGLDTDAGLDTASVDTSTDAGLDTGTQDAEIADGATGPQGETQDEPAPADGKGEFRAVLDGRLAPAAKATIDKLKLENPQLAKAVQRALFAEDRLRRELPGGFKDIADLRAKLEDLGGDEGIQGMRGELDGWKDFDAKYTAGDPAVLKFLTETPEASNAFMQIAPAAFEKFRELNPDGYGAYVSQVFIADMVQSGIPLALERLQDFIPGDNPKAQAVVKQLVDYVNRINGISQKQVSAPKAAAVPADDKRSQELTRRETEYTRKEWSSESSQKHAGLFHAQWKAQIGDRKLSDTQAATVKELYGLKLGAILKATPKFNETLERYFNSKQKDGFLRHFESVYKDAVPKALRAAITQAGVSAKPGPKPGEVAKPGAAPAKPGAKPAPAAGFTLVNAKPMSDSIDRVRTSTDMWLAGKAILKDGKRVQWNR